MMDRKSSDIGTWKKRIFYFLAILLIPFGVCIMLTLALNTITLENAKQQANNSVERMGIRLEKLLSVPITIASNITRDNDWLTLITEDFSDNFQQIQASWEKGNLLKYYIEHSNEIDEVFFYCNDRDVLNTGYIKKAPTHIQNTDWYQQALQRGASQFWAYMEHDSFARYRMKSFGLCRSFLYKNKYLGVLCVYVNSQALQEILEEEDCLTILCTSDGQIVAAGDEALLELNISQYLHPHDSGTGYVKLNGAEYNSIVRRLTFEGFNEDLYIIALYTNDKMFSHTLPITLLAYGSVGLGALASVLALLLLFSKLQKQLLETYQREIQLQVLSSQIDPHFLFNAMESIRMKAVIQGQKETADNIKLISSLMRKSLYRRTEPIPLADELSFVTDYLSIQQIRFDERFTFSIDVQVNIDKQTILPFLLQPLVENAIRHGIEISQKANGYVLITIQAEDGQMVIRVSDNGMGIEANLLSELKQTLAGRDNGALAGHIGLSNVNQRVRLYYGEKFKLEIHSVAGNGTVVALRLPLK